ncbi:hypothetical protein GLW07_19140 [Bacillus hwajinpoensis]|uniref:Uncharacterized protein n=1 Tax=Guptibacillus hwajinpoensis TaxID=208199 RepID=A0A845F410_9BACL|nr:hypothetical protein [Pseudalkalibacillus hwajinpoensis]MYL65478.1 hypothetical protein [Pseudalkalibacillus hwajinpoensis]
MFRRIRNSEKESNIENSYVEVPQSDIREELKKYIIELEQLAIKLCTDLQRDYVKCFDERGKKNLKLWVARDIDGDELEKLTYERCLEKEYRSQIVIDYNGPKLNEEFYAETFELWYYFGDCKKGTGTLYDLKNNDLKSSLQKILQELLDYSG